MESLAIVVPVALLITCTDDLCTCGSGRLLLTSTVLQTPKATGQPGYLVFCGRYRTSTRTVNRTQRQNSQEVIPIVVLPAAPETKLPPPLSSLRATLASPQKIDNKKKPQMRILSARLETTDVKRPNQKDKAAESSFILRLLRPAARDRRTTPPAAPLCVPR